MEKASNISNFSISNEMCIEKHIVSQSGMIHYHNFIEIEIVLSGKGTNLLNGYVLPLQPGYACVLTTQDFHQVLVEEELEIFNISFHEKLFSKTLLEQLYRKDFLQRNIIVSKEELQLLDKLCSIIVQLSKLAKEQPIPQQYLISLVEGIIYRIIDNHTPISFKKTDLTTAMNVFIYLHQHYHENPRISDLAKIFHMAPSSISRLFQKEYHTTYIKYLTQLRLERACHVLTNEAVPITEICFRCGFNSVTNFNASFKRAYGMSPSQFRAINHR